MTNRIIIKCSYCNRFLSEGEYQIVKRKSKSRTKRRITGIHKYNASDSDIPELRTMKSGEKHLWLKNHRDEVLYYLEQHGDAETRRHFGIHRLDILQNIEQLNAPNPPTITKIEILEAKIHTYKQEIKKLTARLPHNIAKLTPEDQVKLLTFQLAEAVSRLHSKTHSEELRIDNLYKVDDNNYLIPKIELTKDFTIREIT